MKISQKIFYSGAVLVSTKFVVDVAKHISINQAKLASYSDALKLAAMHSWLLDAPVDLSSLSQDELLNYIFVFTSLSFSYWGDPDYFFTYQGKTHKTSWGLAVALFAAHKKGLPILDIRYLVGMTDDELGSMLNKDTEMPMFKERGRILRENCTVLCEKFGGSVRQLLQSAGHDAEKLLVNVYENFPVLRDEAMYDGKKVFFMKKGQILIADIDRLFYAPIGKFENADMLTAAADYRLPQLLRHHGILQYSQELASVIDSQHEIVAGSAYEVEIRACTIWANEYIRQYLEKKYATAVKAIEVNDYLWLQAKTQSADMEPFHRTRTVMY